MTTSLTATSPAIVRRSADPLEPPPLASWVEDLFAAAHTTSLPNGTPQHATLRERSGFLLLSIRVSDAVSLSVADLESQTFAAYQSVARQLDHRAMHAVRFWNHVPHINEPMDGGRDRYMVFNAGRYRAFCDWYGGPNEFERQVATASGIGHGGRDLFIHCLAMTQPGIAVENPRQVAPYHYSKRFGPLPPAFARATVLKGSDQLPGGILVGGTASVRGEDSVYLDDLSRQLNETFVNLAALVSAAKPEINGNGKKHAQCTFALSRASGVHSGRKGFRSGDRRHRLRSFRRSIAWKCFVRIFAGRNCSSKSKALQISCNRRIVMNAAAPQYDVVIVGGGPGGATAAMVLAARARKSSSWKRQNSPASTSANHSFREISHCFRNWDSKKSSRNFRTCRSSAPNSAWAMISTAAGSPSASACSPARRRSTSNARCSTTCFSRTRNERRGSARERNVRKIVRLRDGDVAVATDSEEITGKYLFDASGQSTLVGKHRHSSAAQEQAPQGPHRILPALRRRECLAGEEEGHPAIFMSEEGWFWVIPINDKVTSIGLVMDAEIAKSLGAPANQILNWGISVARSCAIAAQTHRPEDQRGDRGLQLHVQAVRR